MGLVSVGEITIDDTMSYHDRIACVMVIVLGLILVSSPRGPWVTVTGSDLGQPITVGAGAAVMTLTCLGVLTSIIGIVALQARRPVSLTALLTMSVLALFVALETRARADSIARLQYAAFNNTSDNLSSQTKSSAFETTNTAIALVILTVVLAVYRRKQQIRAVDAQFPV